MVRRGSALLYIETYEEIFLDVRVGKKIQTLLRVLPDGVGRVATPLPTFFRF